MHAGAAVGAVEQQISFPPTKLPLPEHILNCVVVSGCQHGDSYFSTARTLRLIARTIASVFKGWNPDDSKTGLNVCVHALKRGGLHKASNVLRRLVSLGRKEVTNQEQPRSVLVRHPASIGKRVTTTIANEVIKDLTDVVSASMFVGGCCDESVVCGKTRPMFFFLQCITAAFEWFLLNLGQANTTGNGAGADYAANVFSLLGKVKLTIEQVRTMGTDGCYAMRSNLPGVDCRFRGDSMIAALKSTSANRILAFHCLIHICQLAIRGAINMSVPPFWEGHVRSMYTWGARSVKRQLQFSKAHEDALQVTRQLLEQMQRIREQHQWQWTYFDRYVIVRWETVLKCVSSILKNWPGARGVSNVQREEGWGPKFYNPEDEYDAPPDEPPADDQYDELVELSLFDSGNLDAPKTKRSRLLCPRTGVTDTNWGLNAGLYVVLAPAQVVMKLLQTTAAPIQHLAVRHIQTIKDHLQDVINQNWTTDPVYQPFVDFCNENNRTDLLAAVNNVVESFALSFKNDFERRTEPYMPYYKAMELIDPTSIVGKIPRDVQAAVRDIAVTHGIQPDVVSALIRMRDAINRGRASVNSLSTARKNILTWYSNKVHLRELCKKGGDRYLIKTIALAVFSINIVTAVVESGFSGVKNQKSKLRTQLTDEAASIAQQCTHYQDVTGSTPSSTMTPLRTPTINKNECFEYDYSPHHHGTMIDDDLQSDSDVETNSSGE